MKLKIDIIDATEEHVKTLVDNIREPDRVECEVLGGNIEHMIKYSVDKSISAKAFVVNGDLVCIFGIGKINLLGGAAHPWMLATDDINKYWFSFVRRSIEVVNKWKTEHKWMQNFVHVENDLSIKWLKWLGFKFKKPIQISNNEDAIFYPFELRY